MSSSLLAWPLPSPDLLACFPDIPHAEASRFRCQHYFSDPATLFPDGMARFNVTSLSGEHAWSYRTAWFLADPTAERPLPAPAQIASMIGTPDERAFCWGGATIVSRFAQLLAERLGRPLSSFAAILDWGCGAGRLTRYLLDYGPPVTGVDIDPDMVQLCRQTLPDAEFLPVDLLPPTALATASFDLVLGLAVLPHLAEPVQDAWLAELQRLTRPGRPGLPPHCARAPRSRPRSLRRPPSRACRWACWGKSRAHCPSTAARWPRSPAPGS